MQHPDEGTIHAWLDGELSADMAQEIERHSAECAQCSASVAEARGLIAASSRVLTALDEVPSGVIPRKPVSRPWYGRNDFRAAAAVMLVAGASLVLARNWNEGSSMSSSATRGSAEASVTQEAEDATATASVDTSVGDISTSAGMNQPRSLAGAPVNAAIPTEGSSAQEGLRPELPNRRMARGNQAAGMAPEATARGKTVDAARIGASTPATGGTQSTKTIVATTAPVSARLKESDSRMLDQMVAASAATAAEASRDTLLRKVRFDSTATGKTTVYQVAPGISVTLIESVQSTAAATFSSRPQELAAAAPAPQVQRAATSRAGGRAASPAAPPPPPSPRAADIVGGTLQPGSQTNTISWVDPAGGKRYTLSGALSIQQLEALKRRIFPRGH